MPIALSSLSVIQLMSNSYQARPWRAETGCAWWLLCQPSPNVSSATHQLLRESSRVAKRRRAPHVRRRVHQPGRVQADDDAQEDAPEHHRPAADREQDEAEQRERNVVIGVQPAVEGVGAEVRRIAPHQRGVVVVRVAEEDPAHVGPEPAVARRVRIAVVVGVLMVHAVRGDPEDRPALERQRAAEREEVLERLRRLVAAVRVQPVVAEADAEADRNPVQHQRDETFVQLKKNAAPRGRGTAP